VENVLEIGDEITVRVKEDLRHRRLIEGDVYTVTRIDNVICAAVSRKIGECLFYVVDTIKVEEERPEEVSL
jgi:hypothetical protein